jgi:hypothetical protein
MKIPVHACVFLIACSLALACKDNPESNDEGEGGGEEGEVSRVRTAQDGLYSNRGLSPQVIVERALRRLSDGAFAYQSGDFSDGRFPPSVGRTPAVIPCGEAVAINAADWDHPAWRALGFPPEGPIRYSYQFDNMRENAAADEAAAAAAAAADGSGEVAEEEGDDYGPDDDDTRPSFRVTAYGDLDCDGVLSTFYRGGTAVGYNSVRGDTEAHRINEAE